jgi:hypothetical protein
VESGCARLKRLKLPERGLGTVVCVLWSAVLKGALRCLVRQDVFERPLNVINFFTDHSD